MNKCAKRTFAVAFVLLVILSFADFSRTEAASSPLSDVNDGAYLWYKSVDFQHGNRTEYTYVEFIEVHEYSAEVSIRTGLNSTDPTWRQRSPLFGYLDFQSGSLSLVGATQGLGYSIWTITTNANTNATFGFPPDNAGYSQVECIVLESAKHDQLSWYDQVTGVLIEAIFVSGKTYTRIVTLYETNILVGEVTTTSTQQQILPFEISTETLTYAGLIGTLIIAALAAIILVRRRKKPKTSLPRSP